MSKKLSLLIFSALAFLLIAGGIKVNNTLAQGFGEGVGGTFGDSNEGLWNLSSGAVQLADSSWTVCSAGTRCHFFGSILDVDYIEVNVSVTSTLNGVGNDIINFNRAQFGYVQATTTAGTSTFDGAFIVGTNSLVVDQYDDMVGIGTTTAESALTVIGNISGTGLLFVDGLSILASLAVSGTTTLDTDFTGFLRSDSGVVSTTSIETSIAFSLDTPTTTRAYFVGQMRWPAAVAVTITEVKCGLSAGTTTVELYETTDEARSATGTPILSSSLACNSNASTTSFTDAAIAAGNFIMLYVDTQEGGDSGGDVSIKMTIDD